MSEVQPRPHRRRPAPTPAERAESPLQAAQAPAGTIAPLPVPRPPSVRHVSYVRLREAEEAIERALDRIAQAETRADAQREVGVVRRLVEALLPLLWGAIDVPFEERERAREA